MVIVLECKIDGGVEMRGLSAALKSALAPFVHPGPVRVQKHWGDKLMKKVPACTEEQSSAGKDQQDPLALAHRVMHASNRKEFHYVKKVSSHLAGSKMCLITSVYVVLLATCCTSPTWPQEVARCACSPSCSLPAGLSVNAVNTWEEGVPMPRRHCSCFLSP